MSKIIFIIEQAQLSDLCNKPFSKGKCLKNERSDITHHILLNLIDSPLNKAGKLKIYINTTTNILIELNPKIRIPRTYARFKGLFAQLFKTLKIKSDGEVLMKIIKGPVETHLPPNITRIGLSQQGNTPDTLQNIDNGYAFFINAIPAGNEHNLEKCDALIKVSDFSLSAATAAAKICFLMEQSFNIF